MNKYFMNQVLVGGGNKKRRYLAYLAIQWYIQKFLPRYRALDIVLVIKRTPKDAYGYCIRGETNREFIIHVTNACTEDEFMETVIHEMIHVKQYVKNELSSKGIKTRWKSKWYGDISYHRQPWEKEAGRLDTKLKEEFKTELQDFKEKM